MAKKIVLIFAVGTFFLGVSLTLWADSACRTFFSKCTEGGCGNLKIAKGCKMTCEGGGITCGIPVAEQ